MRGRDTPQNLPAIIVGIEIPSISYITPLIFLFFLLPPQSDDPDGIDVIATTAKLPYSNLYDHGVWCSGFPLTNPVPSKQSRGRYRNVGESFS